MEFLYCTTRPAPLPSLEFTMSRIESRYGELLFHSRRFGRNADATAPSAAATTRVRSRPQVRPPEIETRVSIASPPTTTAVTISASHAALLRDNTSAAASTTDP